MSGTAPPGQASEVARAVAAAGVLLDDDAEHALTLLRWAKATAPRSSVVREALGLATYRTGDYATAVRELTAYRRLSGRQDQNHALADALRATGRVDRVRELVEAMDESVPDDRRVEGRLVYAGALADAGDRLRALAVLERLDLEPSRVEAHHLRLWYLAADLCEQLGDHERAHGYLEAIGAIDPDFLDVAERLADDDEEG